jgi:hypothetical protein
VEEKTQREIERLRAQAHEILRRRGIVKTGAATATDQARADEWTLHCERTCLGAALLNNDLVRGSLNELQVPHFLLGDHQEIFRTMLEYVEETIPFDAEVLAAGLMKHRRQLKAANGSNYLADLTIGVVLNDRHIRHLAEEIIRASRKRELRRRAEWLALEAAKPDTDPERLQRQFEADLARINVKNNNDGKSSKIVIAEIPSVQTCATEGVEFLVPGLLVKGTVTVISGEPSAGKTTLALWLSDSIARGVDVLGSRCEQHPVLYLTRENPLDYIADITRRLNIKDGPDTKLIVWGDWLKESAPDPEAAHILAWVRSCSVPPFIVIDSLSAFFNGSNENDAVEMRTFLNQARILIRTGACGVLILHHPGKAESAKTFRGSSDLKAAIDTGYVLINSGDGLLERLHLKSFKVRFLAQKRELLLDYHDGGFTSEDRPAVIRESMIQTLTKLLDSMAGCSKKQFVAAAMSTGLITQIRARTFLDDGVACGSIQREKGSHGRHEYTLVATGRVQ